MNGSPALAFPNSRTLAAWWNQLAAHRPSALWAGHLLVHRVEALVGRTTLRPLEALDRALLVALAAGPADVSTLDERVHLGPPFLTNCLRTLAALGLAEADAEIWRPAEAGRRALERGEFPEVVYERRPFFFTEGAPGRPPRFLALDPALSVPHPAPPGWTFDAALLRDCVARPDDWKLRYGFPADVEVVAVGPTDAGPGALPAWRRVAVDRTERLPVAIVRGASPDGEKILAFPFRAEGWTLQTDAPVFTLGSDWRDILPELTAESGAADLRQAWQLWCQPRGVVHFEPERVVVEGHRLRVEAAPRAMDRLRNARNDLTRGDGWVLVGANRLRPALLLEVAQAARTEAATG
jgi:hypothetical protein